MKKILLGAIFFLLLLISLVSFASADVVINEFMANPSGSEPAEEWIELYYNGSGSVNLTNWYINDSNDQGDNLTGILNSTNRYVVFNGSQTGISLINSGSNNVSLYNSSNDLINNINYSSTTENESEGRMHDGLSNFVNFIISTPNAANDRLPSGTIPMQNATEDIAGLFNASSYVSDPDGDNLIYSIAYDNELEVNCSIVNSTNVSLVPYSNWNGNATCIIEVDDGYYLTNFTFNISVASVNDAPWNNGTIQDISFNEDEYDDSLNLDGYFVDVEGDNLNFAYSCNSSDVLVDNSTSVVNFTSSGNWSGSALCNFTAWDGTNPSNTSNNIIVTVNSVNDAPVIYNIPVLANMTSMEDYYFDILNLSDYVSDVDNNLSEINWSSTTAENISVYIDNTTKILNITFDANWNGARNITLTATDGNLTDAANATITVYSVNDVPVMQNITNKTVVQDSTLTIDISALSSDVDNNNLTYYDDFAFGSLNVTTGLFEWTPNSTHYGTYDINFSVNDTNGAQDSKIAYIRVFSTLNISYATFNLVNIDEDGVVQGVNPGDSVALVVNVGNIGDNTIDNVNLTLDIPGLVSNQRFEWGNFSKRTTEFRTFLFNISTLIGEGIYNASIKAEGEDHWPEINRYDYHNFSINVTKEVDDIIIENLILSNDTIKDVVQVNLTVNMTNKGLKNYTADDNGAVNLTIFNTALGLNQTISNIDMAAGTNNEYNLVFTIDTGNKTAGTYVITAVASYYDGDRNDTKTITLIIQNSEPVFNGAISNIIVSEDSYNDSINLTDYFTDFNNDTLTYGYEGGANLTISIFDGIVNITPDADFNGTNYVNFTANDGVNTTKSNDVVVYVTGINDAPVITAINDMSIEQGNNFIYPVVASDVDNSVLTYGITSNVSVGLVINQSSGYIYNWTPTNDQVGTNYLVNVSVSDGGIATYELFVVTVTNSNDAPNLSAVSDQTVNESKILQFYLYGSDIDAGDTLTYSCNLSGLTVTKINNTLANVTWTPGESDIGNHSVNCSVTDVAGTQDSKEFMIEVKPYHITYDPAEQYVLVSGRLDSTFRFTLPSGLTSTSIWKENGVVQSAYSNLSTFIFSAKNTSETYHIELEVTDSDRVDYTNKWFVTTTTYPIADPYTTEPDLEDVCYAGLQSINLVIMNGDSKIEFLEPIDISGVLNLSDAVYLEGSIAAINTSGSYSVFGDAAAQITLTGLTYDEEPKIYYNSGFTSNGSAITTECPSSICKIESYTSYPTTNGIVVFNVTHFSSYKTGESYSSVTPTPTPSVTGDLELDVDVDEDELKPDEEVEVTVEVENSGEDDIENIELEVKVLDEDGDVVEDDDDELEDEEDFDLDEDDEEEFSFVFKIPADANDGDEYTIFVEACYEDEDNNDVCMNDTTQTIQIEREKHEVIIYSLIITPLELTCSDNFEIEFDVKNIGKKDEDVVLKITNEALGINEIESFELESGDDEDYKKSVSYSYSIPEDLDEGSYTIKIEAEYDEGDSVESETLQLKKSLCPADIVEDEVVLFDESEEVAEEPVKVRGSAIAVLEDIMHYETALIILSLIILGLIVFAVGALIIRRQ